MSQRVRVMIVSDAEEHLIPKGWFLHSAVALRTHSVNATIALILIDKPVSMS